MTRRKRLLIIAVSAVLLIVVVVVSMKDTLRHDEAQVLNAPRVKLGMTQAQVEEVENQRGRFQFTTKYQGKTYECSLFQPTGMAKAFYFVFEDDELVAIHEMWDFSYVTEEPRPGDGFMAVENPWNTREKVADVLTSPGMTEEEFYAEIEQLREKERVRNEKSLFDSNVWPLLLKPSTYTLRKEDVPEIWETDYSLAYISLGEKREKIEKKFGSPTLDKRLQDTAVSAYGPLDSVRQHSDRKKSVSHEKSRLWLEIHWENDTAVLIASDDFFNHRVMLN